MCSVFGCNNPVHKVCVLNIFLGAGILAQQLRVYTVLVQNQNLLARNCAPAHPLPSSGRYGQLQSHVNICHIGTYKHNLKSMHTYTLKHREGEVTGAEIDKQTQRHTHRMTTTHIFQTPM